MTITAVFENLDEMMCFARTLLNVKEDEGQKMSPKSMSVTPEVLTTTVPNITIVAPTTDTPKTLVDPILTASVNYTLEDLAKAAMMLMDCGKQSDLLNLLHQFSVDALPSLPTEQYGAFATALRGLGAQI